MSKGALYTIERWPHGWLFVGNGRAGIPITAISECAKLFPRKAVMDAGIATHYSNSGRSSVVFCVVTISEAKLWRAEIEVELAVLTPEQRWFRGLDVGLSSAAIFAVLANDTNEGGAAARFSNEATPHDGDDFGRCRRLVDGFPGWRERLGEVAECYPASKWPAIIARWDEIADADSQRATEILRSINDSKTVTNAKD